MDKRNIHHLWVRLKGIKAWYVLVLFLVFCTSAVYQLRGNNMHMSQLREQVYAADKSDGDVGGALQNLRSYVGSHMNTDLSSGENAVYPPVQLKYTYDRLITAKSNHTTDYNAQIYTQAQKYCEAKIPNGFSGRYRIACIQQYVTSHNASPTYIAADLYKFDFYSPTWSPDWAGWSIVLAVVSLITFLVLVAVKWVVRSLAR